MKNEEVTRVRDIMRPNYILMDGKETVREGITRLQKEGMQTILINRRDDNDEYGIVVLRDIATLVIAKDKAPERINLYEIMAKPVLSVDPDMDIRYCSRLFHQFGLSAAPVIKDKEILGLVTYNEIVLNGLLDQQ